MIYADDTLLLLTDLKNSTLNLLKLFNTYSQFSGFKGNKSMSSIMCLTKQECLNPVIDHLFHNALNGFKYLGIHVVPAIWDLLASNYEPVTTAVTDSVNSWFSLPLSLIGHMYTIKMNILTEFLDLFQMIFFR